MGNAEQKTYLSFPSLPVRTASISARSNSYLEVDIEPNKGKKELTLRRSTAATRLLARSRSASSISISANLVTTSASAGYVGMQTGG